MSDQVKPTPATSAASKAATNAVQDAAHARALHESSYRAENESRDTRVRRLKLRSMRRGIKEMDIILDAFAKAHLDKMTEDDLAAYDAMLSENDQDLYQWVTGQVSPPEAHEAMVRRVAAHAGASGA